MGQVDKDSSEDADFSTYPGLSELDQGTTFYKNS